MHKEHQAPAGILLQLNTSHILNGIKREKFIINIVYNIAVVLYDTQLHNINRI